MKKIIALSCATIMTAMLFVGCSSTDEMIDDDYNNMNDNINQNYDKLTDDLNNYTNYTDDYMDTEMNDYNDSTRYTEYKDGTYKAELSEYQNGYKDYVELKIKDGKIENIVFDGLNKTGDYKTKDGDFNFESSKYTEKLLESQTIEEVYDNTDENSGIFKMLVEAALEKARLGDSATATVEYYK